MAMRKKPAAQRPQNGMPAQQQTQMSSAAPYAATGQPVKAEETLRLQASCYDEETEEDVEVPPVAYRVGGG